MKKLLYLFKRIFNMDKKRFKNAIDKVHDRNGKSKFFIFCDMVYCGFRYQAGYMDYLTFEMDKMNRKERKTIITRGINNKFVKMLNPVEERYKLSDKGAFNQLFNKFLNRDWLLLNDNFAEFKNFVNDKSEIIVKPISLCCGEGIEKIKLKNWELEKLYTYLVNNNKVLVEEIAKQNEVLNKLYSKAVNTIRVVTLFGEPILAYLRIGTGDAVVDNFNHGGLLAKVNIKTGIIETDGVSKEGVVYVKHPMTKVKIKGLKIPMWDKVLKLCEDASLVVSKMEYVAWDVCVGIDKPCLIEGNDFPGHDIYNLPAHRENNYGFLPLFLEKINNVNDKEKQLNRQK